MSETRGKFHREFREGAVPIVRDTGKPIAHVARDLEINAGLWLILVTRIAPDAKAHRGFDRWL